MFFLSYILVFTAILHSNTCDYLQTYHNNVDKTNATKFNKIIREAAITNTSQFKVKPTQDPFKSKTKTANLKVNLYDKLLLEEMLYDKPHLYKNNNSVNATERNNSASATFNVNKKYSSILKLKFKEELKTKSDTTNNKFKTLSHKETTRKVPIFSTGKHYHYYRNKSLAVRHAPQNLHLSSKLCSCMRTNPSTSCSHRCSGNNERQKLHLTVESTPISNGVTKLTQETFSTTCTSYTEHQTTALQLPSAYPAFYLPYYNPFQVDENSINVYPKPHYFEHQHEESTKKNKHRKHKKISTDNPYDYTEQEEYENYREYENYLESSELDPIHDPTEKSDEPTRIQILDSFDYKEEAPKSLAVKIVDDSDIFKNLVNDLKEDYQSSNEASGDCFCPSSSSNFHSCKCMPGHYFLYSFALISWNTYFYTF